MMDVTKMIIDANMQALYVLKPKGELLEKVHELEQKLMEYAATNPGAMDIVGEAGLRDAYNKLYMDIMTGEMGSVSAEAVMDRMEDIQSQYDDSAVQKQIMAEISANLDALVGGWMNSRQKIREGHIYMDKYAQAMVVIRKLTRRFYDFIYDDMGLTIEKTDSFTFENKESVKHTLFEEILSSRSIEEILLTK